MTNVIEVNFGNNSKELLQHNQIRKQKVELYFYDYISSVANKLANCNGARPDIGFLKLLLEQNRKRDIKLIKGERNGTQT